VTLLTQSYQVISHVALVRSAGPTTTLLTYRQAHAPSAGSSLSSRSACRQATSPYRGLVGGDVPRIPRACDGAGLVEWT